MEECRALKHLFWEKLSNHVNSTLICISIVVEDVCKNDDTSNKLVITVRTSCDRFWILLLK